MWESLGNDALLGPGVAEKRKAVQKLMVESYEDLIPFIERCEMPHFLVPKIQKTGINGMSIKDHGGPGFSNLEQGVMYFEFAKLDSSIATFVFLHNALGTAVINALGDEE